jgi:hypothetical protein
MITSLCVNDIVHINVAADVFYLNTVFHFKASDLFQPWFRGLCTREQAEKELMNKTPGSFVVRVSQSEPGNKHCASFHLSIRCGRS